MQDRVQQQLNCHANLLIKLKVTYVLLGSGAFFSDTFPVGEVGDGGVGDAGEVGDSGVEVGAGLGGGVNCFCFALASSSAAFRKNAIRSATEPDPNGPPPPPPSFFGCVGWKGALGENC